MKKLLFILCIVLIFTSCMNHQRISSGETDLEAALDSAFLWDIEKQTGGALMYLDVPYVRQNDCDTCQADFLTISVAKYDSRPRPGWIAVIFSNDIDRDHGVFLSFQKSGFQKDLNDVNEPLANPVRANLEESNQEIYIARFKEGYTQDENHRQVDIFQKFKEADMLYLMVFYPDGTHKTISIPLHHFKEQYRGLGMIGDQMGNLKR